MGAALGWGLVAASSLVVGAIAGVVRDWNRRLVGLVLGFGAGALVASISFELAEEGFQVGGALPSALGLAVGAVVFYLADRAVNSKTGRPDQTAGIVLAIGALLDGIPEQAVLGIGMAGGENVSLALVVAVFVSNLPEAIGSATDMRGGRHSNPRIVAGWIVVAGLCAAATVLGYLLAEFTGSELRGGIDGFAAGALLVMLVVTMIPEAREKGGDAAGLAAVLGFAVAAGLSFAS